ncbi:MAG: hypothetical protein IJU76_06850 [Desulfovibrionaceae bacterium]|nr:hypothetical protein [Desulfovibrionaceae bacterium]
MPPNSIRNDPEALVAFYQQKIKEIHEQYIELLQQKEADAQELRDELASRRANENALKGLIKAKDKAYDAVYEKYEVLCKANKKLVDQFTKLLCTFSVSAHGSTEQCSC